MTARSSLLSCALLALAAAGCAETPDAGHAYASRLDLAEAQIERGRYAGARQALEPLRAVDAPAELRQRSFLLLGDTWFADGRWEEALDAWYAARRHPRDEDDVQPLILRTAPKLAAASEKQGRWHAASRHWHEVLAAVGPGPQRDAALVGLARAELRLHHPAEARAHLDQVRDRSTFGYAELDRDVPREPLRPPRPATPDVAAAPAVPAPVAAAPLIAPRVHDRSAWRAQPLRYSGNPEAMEAPWRITVHHGGDGEAAPTSLEGARQVMRKYQGWHFDKKWADIGYHFVIDGAGRVWEGRELRWQGAHAGTAELNRGNVGICLMGTFSRVEPSAEQKRALRELLIWLMRTHRIPAQRVVGHDEILSSVPERGTECPGSRLSAYLKRLRRELS